MRKVKTKVHNNVKLRHLTLGYIIFITFLMVGVGLVVFVYIVMLPMLMEQGQELLHSVVTAIKEMFQY